MSRSFGDTILIWALRACAAIAGAVVLLIGCFVLAESIPALASIGLTRFFSDASWHPTQGLYGLLPMLWGTLLATAGAVLLATPLGIAAGVFCNFYAPPPLAKIYRRILELLAGIPSVVYGFWGLMVLVPLIGRLQPPGPSLLAGILVLTLMTLPTIALTADAAIRSVPDDYRRAAAALGLSRFATVRRVILPVAKSGLLTGVILQVGRALGETMAILMVCGNQVQTPRSVFDPIRTLTANIALEMAYATGSHRGALFVSGLLLLGVIVCLVIVADRVAHRRVHV